ncbi:Uncharacterized protein dnm_026730 [Desulfonema magnum]|uniref:Uncharacterized protein n=1 Tax=Desulfonema magnum TaxID=45655 RepID=A0A975BKB6_9BACT|nr:Uncharacterized protein dnm_026730 [Desulfonema magnum]
MLMKKPGFPPIMKICGKNREKTRVFQMYFHGKGFNAFFIILFLYEILVAK